MGKKGSSSKKAPTASGGSQMSVTMREASTGKKRMNTKSSLKLQHIKNLAVWASHDAAIPSLGAFFGHHLAASSEALATPVDPSLFTCQRCESVLHPGYNCTIRIEKNKKSVQRKGKKITHYPQNNIVNTCHFCSHRNIKRGTPRNTSQPKAKASQKSKSLPKVKTNPKSTNSQSTSNTVSSDMTKDNVVANVTLDPLQPTVDEPDPGNMLELMKVKNGSAEAPFGSTADDPDEGKMGILDISEAVKVKSDSADINTMAAKLGFTEDDPGRCDMGIVEMSETLKVNSADVSTIAAPLVSISDDPDRGKMGIADAGETLNQDGSEDTNTMVTSLGSTADEPDRGKMGIVQISQMLEVRDDFADINTITAPVGSTENDPDDDSMGIVEMSETREVKNDTGESCSVTPLTRPPLTLLESKMGKRNRSGAKKKAASVSRSEALNAENANTSKRKRRKCWTSLKEIAKRDEDEKRKRLMNVTVPFSL
ncbi:uncharacterized protein [Rutidosis leptorrhynchoides]|uniref:uncharacterized protein n=1 Tax=Rutidosis leptorrhynchoides TaxID=125765 RepID=UPI003A98CF5C